MTTRAQLELEEKVNFPTDLTLSFFILTKMVDNDLAGFNKDNELVSHSITLLTMVKASVAVLVNLIDEISVLDHTDAPLSGRLTGYGRWNSDLSRRQLIDGQTAR